MVFERKLIPRKLSRMTSSRKSQQWYYPPVIIIDQGHELDEIFNAWSLFVFTHFEYLLMQLSKIHALVLFIVSTR